MKKKLAIISTHPIQYNAPMFRMLTERGVIEIRIFYTWGEGVLKDKYDPGFGKVIEWDIPLLQGYEFEMVENISKNPGSHHYNGIDNPQLCRIIEQWNADAVLVFGWSFKSHFSCMRYFHGKIPVIFRGDSTLLDQGNNLIKNLARKLFLRYVYRHADFFLYTGNANKDYYLNAGVSQSKLVFAPHAIDNSRFANPMKIDFRKTLGIREEESVFLYAGKFEAKKNPAILIRAFGRVSSYRNHLVMVGNGPMENEIKSQVAAFSESIQSRIHFMDFQNQSMMPDVYKCCDVFVLPSGGPGETWGLAVNEAMASSKAVLVSDKCGAAYDLVIHGVNGTVFKSGSIDSLSEKMQLLIQDKNKVQEMGRQSCRIIDKWSFQAICRAIEETVTRGQEK